MITSRKHWHPRWTKNGGKTTASRDSHSNWIKPSRAGQPREFGLEAAQLVLGHSSALITDAIYAERDAAKVMEVMKGVG